MTSGIVNGHKITNRRKINFCEHMFTILMKLRGLHVYSVYSKRIFFICCVLHVNTISQFKRPHIALSGFQFAVTRIQKILTWPQIGTSMLRKGNFPDKLVFVHTFIFFSWRDSPPGGLGLFLIHENFGGSQITHNDTPQSVGFLWTSDQLVVETSTWQHTTLTTDKYPCPWWDSNPRSQQASGRRPTP